MTTNQIQKLTILFSLLGGLFSLIAFVHTAFAFENQLQIEINTPWQNPNNEYRWLTQNNHIPASQFVGEDNNFYLWNSNHIDDGYHIGSGGLNYSSIQSLGYYNLEGVYLGFTSDYSVSGVYYLYMTRDYYPNHLNHVYAVLPFYVNKELGTITVQSLSTNGVCGADHNQTINNAPPTIPYVLCSSGTAGTVYWDSIQSQWLWSCSGSGGGSNASCHSYASQSYLLGGASFPQCGTATYTRFTTTPTDAQACTGGTVDDMTFLSPSGQYSWTCNIGTSSIDCLSMSIAPVIVPDIPTTPESIVCSWDDLGGCLTGVASWIFLPRQETIDDLFSLPEQLTSKQPFGFFYAIADKWRSISLTTEEPIVFEYDFHGETLHFFNSEEVKTALGTTNWNIYWSLMKMFLWLSFATWVWNKSKSLFNNNKEQ